VDQIVEDSRDTLERIRFRHQAFAREVNHDAPQALRSARIDGPGRLALRAKLRGRVAPACRRSRENSEARWTQLVVEHREMLGAEASARDKPHPKPPTPFHSAGGPMRILGYIALASMAGSLAVAATVGHRPAIIAVGQVPLSFERATTANTRWIARGNGYRLVVGATDVEVGLNDEQLRIQFIGGDKLAASTGLDSLPGKINYFVGRDPKAWLRDIPTYDRVRYKGVYPGIDTVWYGKQGRLEYDLEIQPGANVGRIAMRFRGARKLTLAANGDLRVEMAGGSISLKQPVVYQGGRGGRRRITGGYELRAENEVRFHLAAYDKTLPLVIDPTLVYATYFGSSYPTVNAVAMDGSGNIYMGGYASSGSIPAVNAEQPGMVGVTNAFITKFDPTGKTILYSTYLGGSQYDYLFGIAVDSTSGNLVGVGQTQSPDFPVVNAVQPAFGGNLSAFAFMINSSGNGLVYSTYLGGLGSASGYAAALDTSGNAYFTGYANGLQTTSGALNNCCTFVAKLSNAGSEVYVALIGAAVGQAIAVDAQGAAYIAGYGYANSFVDKPPGAQQINAGATDAFVAKLNPDATSLVWATFLGGTGNDSANAIALGSGNVVYFGGQTSSSDLPVTQGVVQGNNRGGTDAFVASLSADGSAFGFVTYLGGGSYDSLVSLAAGAGGLTVAGNTLSRDFPIASAIEPAYPAPPYAFLKSNNSGASFTPADSGLPTSYAGLILPDPSAAGTILMDTGQGIFRSTDDGATWTNVEPNSNGSTVRSLSNPSVLYTADGCSLYKSTDGGMTWSARYTTCSPNADSVAISPTDPNTVLVFGGDSEYRSTDGGTTFSQVMTTPFSCNCTGNQYVASPDGSLYAVAGGLYKSTDAGLTWTQLGNGAPSYFAAFALSASNPAVLYGTDGNNVYQSTNGGATWSLTAMGTVVNYLAVDPSNPQIVYGTSTQGTAILTSIDGGVTWISTGAVLDSAYIEGLAVNPSNSAELYVSDYVPQSGFISKLSTDGKTLLWSTYYGPYDYAQIGGAALSPSGEVWIAGSVDSGSLPLTPDARNGNVSATGPAFLAEVADATAPCAYTINPATQYSYSAGRLALSVTAPNGCTWTATPSASWIHLIRNSGTGSGTIPLVVEGNASGTTRNGTVNVNSQIYSIVQPPSSCTYMVSNPALTSAGGTATISVTAPPGCPWDVEFQNSDPALVTSGYTGTGNGTVTISVPPNDGMGRATYKVQIGGSTSVVSEAVGVSCIYSFPNGTSVALPADALPYSIQINAPQSGCAWNASTDQRGWLTLNNPNSTGSGLLSYNVALNNTGVDRTAHITVGSQRLTVQQDFTPAEFDDVPPSVGYFDAVNLMFEAGVTTGCAVSNSPLTRPFCPNNNVTRDQMAAFLVRAVTGENTPTIYNHTPYFADVPPTDPFFPHVQKMMELGITAGCSQGPPALYCPNDTIPRWAMAMFLVRARFALYGAAFTTATTPYFADVPTNVEGNGMPFPFIQRSYEDHITNGCGISPLIYCPDELVTRWQMALFIMRALFNETTILGPTAPMLTGVTPNTMAAAPSAQIAVTITSVNTNFQTGDTVTVPSGMLSISNVLINSATSISATLTANANVAAGPQALVVATGGQSLTLPLAIQVGLY
jgi:photosystem II stability/assembly factor-like uncharacterized protein